MIELPLFLDGARPAPWVELLRSPGNPAIQVASALDRVRRAPTILEGMRTLGLVTPVVDATVGEGVDSHALLEPIVEAIHDETDTLTALAAVHALARVPGPRAALELADLLAAGDPGYEEHVLWALAGRPATEMLAWPVARAVGRGGIAGMHAQEVLATWATTNPRLVLAALGSVLSETEAGAARRYLVETIGLVPGAVAGAIIERVALDPAEAEGVRLAAVSAYSERPARTLPAAFELLEGKLGRAVRAVRADRQLRRRSPSRSRHDGLRVAQIHLAENGGLSTLLPQLGDALARQQRVAEPLTIVRAGSDAAPLAGHRLETIALEPGEGGAFTSRWPSTVAAARGIRSAFLAGPLPDVVHLRMADPGTYAAARVAMSLAVPLVFTLAPDPHGPIAAAEDAGTLDRRSFASADARGALWFRTGLVERLAREARELVLFPRDGGVERIESLTGLDLTAGPPRLTVVAEGIDLERTDRATAAVGEAQPLPPVLAELERAIRRLPRERHGLPLVVSAGRMVELKGMARLVEAFARDGSLSARANLVIVGGELGDPSAAEAAELARIRHLYGRYPGLEQRVVLLGQRSHREVALVLATARAGLRSLVAAGGSYACASAKEEFGLAIVEALAAGLPVTAPRAGGPATYVEPGRTGALVDTTDPDALAQGVVAALDLAADRRTAGRARAVVEDRYTLDRMARSLTAVYRVTAGASTLAVAPFAAVSA
ncbi:MAG: glycosyltransferase [Candidatus Limnocylindrales bacterium]